MRLLSTAAFALALTPVACGWIVGEIAAQKARHDALDEQVYDEDLGKIWSELRPLWESDGCSLAESPTADTTFDCETNGDKKWIRVNEVSNGHKVIAEHEVEHTDSNDRNKKTKRRERDYDFEWRLMQNLDPDRAQSIDAAASARGEKAKKAAKDLAEAFE